jgi:hypothetical protein
MGNPIFLFMAFLLPEQLIQGFPEHPGDTDAQVEGGIIFPAFDKSDGLTGGIDLVRKLLLGKSLPRGGFSQSGWTQKTRRINRCGRSFFLPVIDGK